MEAIHRSENWAVRKLRSLQPEFTKRVKRCVDSYILKVQMAELEARRKVQRDREIDGPRKADDFINTLRQFQSQEQVK